MSSAVSWLILAVRNVSRGAIPSLAERVHALLTVPSAKHAHARQSTVANVPDTTFSVSSSHILLFNKLMRVIQSPLNFAVRSDYESSRTFEKFETAGEPFARL